jgi:hypothetical protein
MVLATPSDHPGPAQPNLSLEGVAIMAVSESRQLALFDAARGSWGEDPARTLMEMLVPGWNPELVRRRVEEAALVPDEG